MVFFLLLVVAALVLGIIGLLAEGLMWLLAIGIVVLVLAFVAGGVRLSRRSARHPAR
jgi:quinol-cytochrome oxidoreductase complex cytochrome b subunit